MRSHARSIPDRTRGHNGAGVAPNRELAQDYAYDRAISIGADECVAFELDVPDAAVEMHPSPGGDRRQLQLPAGCPPSWVLSIDDSDPRPFQPTA